MSQATLPLLWLAVFQAVFSAASRVGSQGHSAACAQSQNAPLRIAPPFAHEDNGLQLQYADQRHLVLREIGPRLALLGENLGTVTYHGEQYVAQRAEIRSPAEHVLGKHRPALEVQIFHRANSGKTLGVSILFQVGSSRSRFLDSVLRTLKKKGAPGKARPVVLAQGLGKFLSQRADYFSYAASSCDEDTMARGQPGVDRWVVLSKMKRVTADQLVLLQKQMPNLPHASRSAQNRAPQTVLFSTRAKQENPAPHAAPIAMVQTATTESKSRYSELLSQQATEQYKAWQHKVDNYEAQVMQARQRYQSRFTSLSGTMSKEQLQQEQQKYIAWEQGVRLNEMQLQAQRAKYIQQLQYMQNVVGASKSQVAASVPKDPRRTQAFVNVASTTHRTAESEGTRTVSEVDNVMQSRLAALVQREKRVAEEERHIAVVENALTAREKQDSAKERKIKDREQKDAKREQSDAAREQKDFQLENQEKYLQAQIQQSQQILWQEAAGLQAREVQAAQATQAARAAQVAAQQVEAQAEQVLAYTNPQNRLLKKGRAGAETKQDAETFRFQLGSSVHTVRRGQPVVPVAAYPVPVAAAQQMSYAQPMAVPQQQMPQQPVAVPQQVVQQPVAAAPSVQQAKAQVQQSQLLPGATVVNHGAEALLQVKQLNKAKHNVIQKKVAPALPSMEDAMKAMPAADGDNADNDDSDFPPPPAVDIPQSDADHEDA